MFDVVTFKARVPKKMTLKQSLKELAKELDKTLKDMEKRTGKL